MADYLLLKTVPYPQLDPVVRAPGSAPPSMAGWRTAPATWARGGWSIATSSLADWLFTTPPSIVQPVTGVCAGATRGISADDRLAGGVDRAVPDGRSLRVAGGRHPDPDAPHCRSTPAEMPLPARYFQLSRTWFLLGWPAFNRGDRHLLA